MRKTGAGSVLKRSRIFKSGINRRAMKAARESIALLTEEKQGKADYSSNYLIKKIFIDKHNQKFQSAMEYLMTYGWAILVIAVVLGALYSLGVFNSTNFSPKAPPGSCQVFRPYGPYTTSFINLEGVCNGELPQYAAQFNGRSYILVPAAPNIEPAMQITIAGWVEPKGTFIQYSYPTIVSDTNGGYTIQACTSSEYSGESLTFWLGSNGNGNTCGIPGDSLNFGTWYMFAVTYNGVEATEYIDGSPVYSQTFSTTMRSGYPVGIGTYSNSPLQGAWNGSIADVQIYNTSLSANEIQALYTEGLGGAPIDLQNLVAWYPLNGDANDYSGNGNNGVPTNVTFVSNWWSGYTPP
ncbi:MAG: LamG domain-containing protein [Candidatus Micrarchaeaceae archaeon]